MLKFYPLTLLVFFFSSAWAQKPELVLPTGHSKDITSISFSPDGQQVLTGSRDQTAILWSITGDQLVVLSGHNNVIFAVAFSPKEKILATASADQTIKLWDLEGNVLKTFSGHTSWIKSLQFSPSGKELLSGSLDQTAKLWNLQGNVLRTFSGHEAGINTVDFSADGKSILTGSRDQTAKLWEVATGELKQTFSGHTEEITGVQFAPGADRLLTVSADQSIKIWRIDGTETQELKSKDDEITAAAFSADGKSVAAGLWRSFGGVRGRVGSFDLENGQLDVYHAHDWPIKAIAFSPDGSNLLTGSSDDQAKLWNLDGKLIQSFAGKVAAINSTAFTPDGEKILMGTWFDGASLWNLRDRKFTYFKPIRPNTSDLVAISPDGNNILTAGIQGGFLWDFDGNKLQEISNPKNWGGNFKSVAFSPDGTKILTGSEGNNTSHLWDLQGQLLASYEGQRSWIPAVAFTPDGQSVLIGNSVGEVKLWDLQGNPIRNISNKLGDLHALAISSDGKMVVIRHGHKVAELWTINGENLRTLRGHSQAVRSVAFSPDGQYIVTGSQDKTARLWDLQGQLIHEFKGHNSSVSGVSFTPNGKHLMTVSGGALRIWDAMTGSQKCLLLPFKDGEWVVTTPSGLFDASAGAFDQLHYRIYDRSEQSYEAIDVEQLKARYYEPGLLDKILGYSEESIRPVQDFGELDLYPRVEAKIDGDVLSVTLEERNGGIGKVSVFVNGKEVAEEINPLPRRENPERAKSIAYDLSQHQNYLLSHPDSTNIVSIRAYNEAGWLKSRAVDLVYSASSSKGIYDQTAGQAPDLNRWLHPKLFVVTVGTSDYAGSNLDLKYADQDAMMMALALESAGSKLFERGRSGETNLEVYCFSTTESDAKTLSDAGIVWQSPAKQNIEATFEQIKAKAKAEDVLVLYMSGHGVTQSENDQTQFYYLTKGIGSEDALGDPGLRDAFTISSEELTQWIKDIPALKQVMIIDACYSGQVVQSLMGGSKRLSSNQVRALDRMKDRTGLFILSGSASDKVSWEASGFGQGLLTYSLLKGMKGVAAKKTPDGETIDVMKLFQYARDEVPNLAKGINRIQTPMMGFPTHGASFDIGILDDDIKSTIQLSDNKPIVIKSNFMNQKTLRDDLGLEARLEKLFRKETARGRDADVIYVDVSEYPGAWSVGGLYEISDNKETGSGREAKKITLKLFKGTEEEIPIQIDDPEPDVEDLALQIFEAIIDELLWQ
ncbi:MAG: caspase family protein [Saprospiraceae bacterium]|nr:caspase family protein [Saprospiraceae bacterium]